MGDVAAWQNGNMNSKTASTATSTRPIVPDSKDPMAAYAARVDAGSPMASVSPNTTISPPICGAWKYLDEACYLAEVADWRIARLRFLRRRRGRLRTHKVEGDIRRKLQQFPFDFVIGSIHRLDPLNLTISDREIEHFYDDAIFEQILTEYAEFSASLPYRSSTWSVIRAFSSAISTSASSPASRGKLAHPRAGGRSRGTFGASDKLVEVNTSGPVLGVETTMRATPFFSNATAHGGRTISLGSDSRTRRRICGAIRERRRCFLVGISTNPRAPGSRASHSLSGVL